MPPVASGVGGCRGRGAACGVFTLPPSLRRVLAPFLARFAPFLHVPLNFFCNSEFLRGVSGRKARGIYLLKKIPYPYPPLPCGAGSADFDYFPSFFGYWIKL